VGISVRTLRSDLAFMESEMGYGAEIERYRVSGKWCYRYLDPDFSINKQPLNENELIQITSSLDIISRFSGMPQFEWVGEIIAKINNGFEIKGHNSEAISFDSNQYLKGVDFFGRIFNALVNKEVLDILYKPFKSPQSIVVTLHPYYMKQFNNRWFLFGMTHGYTNVSTFALDRIDEIRSSKIKFIPNTIVNFIDYFEDIIGVSRPMTGVLEKIELWFEPNEAPYVLTKPLHGSQKVRSNDSSGLIISLELIPNIEFERLIMSFGEKVKVLTPKKISDAFAELYRKALGLYSNG
jgi:predicted DNA-binding transcriptional regulator YafY